MQVEAAPWLWWMQEWKVTQDRGTIVPVYSVFCACGMWTGDYATTRKSAKYRARKMGWKLTREAGWVCPDCQNGKDRVT